MLTTVAGYSTVNHALCAWWRLCGGGTIHSWVIGRSHDIQATDMVGVIN